LLLGEPCALGCGSGPGHVDQCLFELCSRCKIAGMRVWGAVLRFLHGTLCSWGSLSKRRLCMRQSIIQDVCEGITAVIDRTDTCLVSEAV
jgi:hypothetical protein